MLIHGGHVPTKVTKSLDGKRERVDQTFHYVGRQGQLVAFHRTHWRKVKKDG
jgi:hypothetical protein